MIDKVQIKGFLGGYSAPMSLEELLERYEHKGNYDKLYKALKKNKILCFDEKCERINEEKARSEINSKIEGVEIEKRKELIDAKYKECKTCKDYLQYIKNYRGEIENMDAVMRIAENTCYKEISTIEDLQQFKRNFPESLLLTDLSAKEKEILLKSFSEGKVKEVAEQIQLKTMDDELRDSVTQWLADYNILAKRHDIGTITEPDYQVASKKLNFALNKWLNDYVPPISN